MNNMAKYFLALTIIMMSFVHESCAEIDRINLDKWVITQDYTPIRDYIYGIGRYDIADQYKLIYWLKEKADEGHAPLMYFLVRYWIGQLNVGFISQVCDPFKIEDALVYNMLSLIRIKQDCYCFRRADNVLHVHEYFARRYKNVLFKRILITPEIYRFALDRVKLWFKDKDLYEDLPSPQWVENCKEEEGYLPGSLRYLSYQSPDCTQYSIVLFNEPEDIRNRRKIALQNSLADLEKTYYAMIYTSEKEDVEGFDKEKEE